MVLAGEVPDEATGNYEHSIWWSGVLLWPPWLGMVYHDEAVAVTAKERGEALAGPDANVDVGMMPSVV